MVDSPLLPFSLHARELVRQVDNCVAGSDFSKDGNKMPSISPFPKTTTTSPISLHLDIYSPHSLTHSIPSDGRRRDLKFHYARKPITVYSFLRRWPSGLAPGGAEQPVPIRRKVPARCMREPSVGRARHSPNVGAVILSTGLARVVDGVKHRPRHAAHIE